MKLTKKQRSELETIQYFTPSWVNFKPVTDNDIETFFGWSDRGKKYSISPKDPTTGLASLHYGKQYREVQIAMWKEDIKLGFITKGEILSDMPDVVATWVEKALQGTFLDDDSFRHRMIKGAI